MRTVSSGSTIDRFEGGYGEACAEKAMDMGKQNQ